MDGIGWCAVAMERAESNLDTAANRLANASTDGFGSHVRPLRETGRTFDLTVTGDGTLHVAPRDARGRIVTAHVVSVKSGSFARDRDGFLVDRAGRTLIGPGGPINVPLDCEVRSDGTFVRNGVALARVALGAHAALRSGVVEGSGVDSIGEMVAMLDAQRSFETAQKTLTALDQVRNKASNEVGQLR